MQCRSNPTRLVRAFFCLVGSGALVACSSNQITAEQQAALMSEYAKQQTLQISCSGPCSLSYKDPRDKLSLPKQTNGYDVANTLINTAGSVATGAAPWAAVTGIVKTGFEHTGDNVSSSYNNDSTHAPVVVDQPAPVVVTAPDPVVVTAPDPVVVQQ